ncbi:MAG TPA: S41 family peptidase [Allosphingosinicella sp.]|jgi:hypothetical protein|nr:S41 family peptidase [Allosphingosinicella sp.]
MRYWKLAAAIASCAAAPAAGQADSAARHWQGLTQVDVEAAHRMLSEDHPGAAPEAGDEAFRRRLASAYSVALGRARQVGSFEGYSATLAGFAASLGDKHIWSRPLYSSPTVEWAGLLIARRNSQWVVIEEREAADGAPLKGASLVSCDSVAADRLAEQRLGGFRIQWPIEAQRVQRAPWLLLDDGNPFLKRPDRCLFSIGSGAPREVPLRWRSLQRSEIPALLKPFPTRGAAGLGVRKAGAGWWIGLETLSADAQPVVEQVRAQAEAMKRAPYIVLDLRGNSGGSSHFGPLIANAIFGERFVQARLRGMVSDVSCPKVWRVSPRNLERLEFYKTRMGPQLGNEAVEGFAREYASIQAARAAGNAFSGNVACGFKAPARPAAGRAPPPEFRGRLILLTDNSCFSSCLLVTDQFRRLGALHVGEATDANTNYMEVREDKLPSGLSMFSTLQAVAPASPAQIGPFVPEVAYEGSIADTAALEAWVQKLAAR